MTTKDQIVEYVVGLGYTCRYDQVSEMLVIGIPPFYGYDFEGALGILVAKS